MSDNHIDKINPDVLHLIKLEHMIISLSDMIERQTEKIERLEERIENWVIINEKNYEDTLEEKQKENSDKRYNNAVNVLTTLFSPIAMPLSLWMSLKVLF
jgi:hypothetical protein